MSDVRVLHLAKSSPLHKLTRPTFRTILYVVRSYLVGNRINDRECVVWRALRTASRLRTYVYEPSGIDESEVEREIAIVYLHGSGERGDDMWRLRLDSLPRLIDERFRTSRPFPFRVVAPICPMRTEWTKTKISTRLETLVRELSNMYPHVFVTGPSMGGRASWRLAAKCADVLSGAIPICGGGRAVFASLVANRVPIWFFHAANDTCIDVSETDALVRLLRVYSRSKTDLDTLWCAYTRYETCACPWNAPWFEGHDAFNPAYRSIELWKWVRRIAAFPGNSTPISSIEN